MLDALSPLEVLRLYPAHDYTLAGFLRARVDLDPQAEAMVEGERHWSRGETFSAAERLATTLQSEGVLAGDRVVILAKNAHWHVLTLIACGLLGAVFVPVNAAFNKDELAYVLGHATPKLVLSDDPMPAALAEQDGQRILPLSDRLLASEARTFAPRLPSEPLLMIYTSGTTGFPKGALHSHRSLILAGEAFVGRMHLQSDERMLLILPMFHINALFYSVAGAWAAGAVLVIEEKFSASKFWQVACAQRITQVNMIEAVVSILLARPAEEYRPDHTIRKIYGIRQAMVARVKERFGVEHPVGGYGMTEIPGVIATEYAAEAPAFSMGRLCAHPDPDMPWARCRIVDDHGDDVAQGETGELWVSTPVRMIGYLNDLEQTEASFSGEWFKTGDLVRQHAEGDFFFVARKKDIIRVRGENVSGAEVDRVLLSHPDVELAAAVGVPSAMGDEDIIVGLRLRDGADVDELSLRQWCSERLLAVKVPKYFDLSAELPLTPTHKVQKLQYRASVLSGEIWKRLQNA